MDEQTIHQAITVVSKQLELDPNNQGLIELRIRLYEFIEGFLI